MKTIRFLLIVCLSVILLLLFTLGFTSHVQAETGTQTDKLDILLVTRKAPLVVDVGQKFWVVIEIENQGYQISEFKLIEHLGNADFDQSLALPTLVDDPGYGIPFQQTDQTGFNLWVYEWTIRLEPGQKTNLAYWLVVHTPGIYVISPAQIIINQQNLKATSWVINVQCVANGVCANTSGENFMTCPDDCPSGASDSLCDGVQDGIVDPDCDAGFDLEDGSSPSEEPSSANPLIPKGLRDLCPSSAALALFPIVLLAVFYRRTRKI